MAKSKQKPMKKGGQKCCKGGKVKKGK